MSQEKKEEIQSEPMVNPFERLFRSMVELDEAVEEINLREVAEDVIKNQFTYHSPKASQIPKYVQLREKGCELALLINELCPPSDMKHEAVKKVREAIMWANAAIACEESE